MGRVSYCLPSNHACIMSVAYFISRVGCAVLRVFWSLPLFNDSQAPAAICTRFIFNKLNQTARTIGALGG